MIFIDANIFLELMLGNKKAENCKNFFEKIKNKEIEALTSDFIIYTCLLQIQYKTKSLKSMKNFILFINSLEYLHVIRSSFKEMYFALDISKKYNLDFDDSLVVSLMTNNQIKRLVSFDAHFDRVSLIKREEPKDF